MKRDGKLHAQVVAVAGEARVRLDLHLQEEVAGSSGAVPGVGLAREPDPLAVADSGWDLHREPAGLPILTTQLQLALGALVRLAERDLDRVLHLHVRGPRRGGPPASAGGRRAEAGSPAPEDRLEEVGEVAGVVAKWIGPG